MTMWGIQNDTLAAELGLGCDGIARIRPDELGDLRILRGSRSAIVRYGEVPDGRRG